MKWLLIYISVVTPTDVHTKLIGVYDSMYQCFKARDIISPRRDGHFPVNNQAMCIRSDRWDD